MLLTTCIWGLAQISVVAALPQLVQQPHSSITTTIVENLVAVVTNWPLVANGSSTSTVVAQESIFGAGVADGRVNAARLVTTSAVTPTDNSTDAIPYTTAMTFVFATTFTTVMSQMLANQQVRVTTRTITDMVTTTALVTETDWMTTTDYVTITDAPSSASATSSSATTTSVALSSSSTSTGGSSSASTLVPSTYPAPLVSSQASASSLSASSTQSSAVPSNTSKSSNSPSSLTSSQQSSKSNVVTGLTTIVTSSSASGVMRTSTLTSIWTSTLTSWTTILSSLPVKTTLATSQVQSVAVTTSPQSTGTVISSLETHGRTTAQPFNTTVIPTPSSSISRITTGSAVISANTTAPQTTLMASQNIFAPIATGAPPSQITTRGDHPVARLGINQQAPISTNKFYANFFLGGRGSSSWTHPYSLSWAQGGGQTGSWGIAVSQIDRKMLAYGGDNPVVANTSSYFINPIGLQYMVLSARELGNGTALTMDSLRAFSANVNLAPASGAVPMITFPLVQGMGFVTAIYNAGTPLLQSGIFFNTLTFGGVLQNTSTSRYQAVLNDGSAWFIYMTPSPGNYGTPTLTLTNNSQIVANQPFTGSIQVAKNPNTTYSQAVYDGSAGVYPLRGNISASVAGATANYNFSWTKGGNISRPLLMFALPHHVESLSTYGVQIMNNTLQLETTTKGLATAVVGDSWTIVEDDLPYDMGFAPWSPALKSQATLPAKAVAAIQSAAASELNQDFNSQTNLDSMYYSGKGLAKFAAIVYTANDLASAPGLASAGLLKLKDAFNRFVNNTQIWPLVYDTAWGGVVSSGSYVTNNSGLDFGNTYYNDHHFHYGYFVYTAAVIAYLDPTWLNQGTNAAWVNTLVRDYANPVMDDKYFPFSRSFDWFHGHSWAKGLFESGDGKDEESSSEDAFASYAIKMWGRAVGDQNMEARGNLMLAIQARSLNNYFLMSSNNTVQPAKFIGNKVTGILFENKCDHATYFGANPEYIQGIHMLPLNPSSTLTRPQGFVAEEWTAYFNNGRADLVAGGWRGVLYANLAIIDPVTSYNFFAQSNFSNEYLDGGASRTWYLAWAAGLGGASH